MTEKSASEGQPGFTVWITGLPYTGKKETANILSERLRILGLKSEVLIGSEIRRLYESNLGFSKEEVYRNVRRIAFECKLLSDNEIIAIAVTISPYRELRLECRRTIGRFVEVYHHARIDILKKRDKRELFKKAEKGELSDVAGITFPYEETTDPEVLIDSETVSPFEAASRILVRLQQLEWLKEEDHSVLLRQEEKDIRRLLRKASFK